jgi:hypothetical protein
MKVSLAAAEGDLEGKFTLAFCSCIVTVIYRFGTAMQLSNIQDFDDDHVILSHSV